MTRDEYWTRDTDADDADRRLAVCPACRAGEHGKCEGDTHGDPEVPMCDCDCHGEQRVLRGATAVLLTTLARDALKGIR